MEKSSYYAKSVFSGYIWALIVRMNDELNVNQLDCFSQEFRDTCFQSPNLLQRNVLVYSLI